MNLQSVSLPWGNEEIMIDLPAEWQVTRLEPSPLPGVSNVLEEARRSLASPVSMPPLTHLAKPGMKIVLVVDDGSRPTPVDKILPAVVEELKRAEVNLSQVTVVPALGVHRPMSAEELSQRLGGDWLSQMNWESVDCDDPERLVNLGTSSRGTPVLLNKTVAEADLVICMGCIEPHIIASFGGGYKNLFPGVAARQTIAYNHALNCTPNTFNMVGQPIERNPMRMDLEECGRMLKPAVFIVNAILNSALEVVQIVSGDPIGAHRAGVGVSASIYGVPVAAPADVIITDSHPMDQDLRQGVKALANTIRAVKPGGVMLTLVKADEGVGVFGLANQKLPIGRNMLKLLAPLLLPRIPHLKLSGIGEEDRFFLYFALQAMRYADLLFYGPTIPQEIHERLPFVTFVNTIEEGLQRARRRYPAQAKVLIFPYGGSTYPILPQ